MSHLYFFIQSVDIFMEIFHLWKFDSKGQNKYKRCCTKILIEICLL